MNKEIRVEISKAGKDRLGVLETPLNVQLELLFSCVLRKRILFRIPSNVVTYPMKHDNEKLNIHFRPVMTKVCMISEVEDAPDLEDFPIHKAKAFMPNWLKLDYQKKKDVWTGEYGWI